MNRTEIAAALGTSMVTIDAWQREGMPCRKRGSRGRSYTFDESECRAWLATREAYRLRGDDLRELAEAWIFSFGGPIQTTRGDLLAEAFGWTWADVREAIAWGLPFASSGAADDGGAWSIPLPHALRWFAETLSMLERHGIRGDSSDLPTLLRGLRIRAGIPLVEIGPYAEPGERKPKARGSKR